MEIFSHPAPETLGPLSTLTSGGRGWLCNSPYHTFFSKTTLFCSNYPLLIPYTPHPPVIPYAVTQTYWEFSLQICRSQPCPSFCGHHIHYPSKRQGTQLSPEPLVFICLFIDVATACTGIQEGHPFTQAWDPSGFARKSPLVQQFNQVRVGFFLLSCKISLTPNVCFHDCLNMCDFKNLAVSGGKANKFSCMCTT